MNAPGETHDAPQQPARAGAAGASRSRLARAGAATVTGQIAGTFITLTFTVVLARILQPTDFGLLAMVYALALFISSFRDFGLPMAALQAERLDQLHASALFWINLPLSVMVALFMVLMGPVIAWFFAEPQLITLTAIMSLGVFVSSLTGQHEAHLMRGVRFGLLVKIDLAGLIIAGAAAIALAAAGAGYWALVAQFLIAQFIRAAATWRLSGWTPTGLGASRPAIRHIRNLLSFGAYLTGYRILSHGCRDLDRVLVGYIGGTHILGLYDASLKWARLPLQQFYTPLLGPAVAGLSQVRDNPEWFRRRAAAILTPVLAISIPPLAFGAVFAESLILLLLGAQWAEAAPFFRVLCIGVVPLAILKTTKWLYLSTGAAKRQFRWGLFASPAFALALIAGLPWGAYGVAVAYAAGQWMLLLPGLAVCLHRCPMTLAHYLSILARPLTLSLAAAGVSILVSRSTDAPNLVAELLLTGSVFSAVYAAGWLVIPGGRAAAADMLNLIRLTRSPARAGLSPAAPDSL